MGIKRNFLLFGIVLFTFLTLSSCGRQQYNRSLRYASENLAEVKARPVFDRTGMDSELPQSDDRKVIFNASLYLVVEYPDTANHYIEQITKKYEGYVNKLGTEQTIIRVKSQSLDQALDDLAMVGKVRNQSINGQDVTNTYFDFKIRLENAEKARSRYLELLEKAVTVEEILQVEKELERLNEKIDLIKGQMNRIEHLDAFSTITINLREKKKPGLLGYIGLGLYHSVKWLFVRN